MKVYVAVTSTTQRKSFRFIYYGIAKSWFTTWQLQLKIVLIYSVQGVISYHKKLPFFTLMQKSLLFVYHWKVFSIVRKEIWTHTRVHVLAEHLGKNNLDNYKLLLTHIVYFSFWTFSAKVFLKYLRQVTICHKL